MTEVLDSFLDSNEWIEVGKDEYAMADSEILGVDCLGTCLGVAAYDPNTGTGYLMHATTLENEDFEQDLNDFLGEVEQLERPYEVLVGGTMAAEYNPLSERDFTDEARQIAEISLESRGIGYEAAWNDAPVFNRLFVSPEYGILYDTTC